MNKNELAREIFSDNEVVDRKATYLLKDIAKKARKRKMKMYHTVVPYKSPRKNDWTIILWYQKKYSAFQTFLQMEHDRGFQTVLVMPEDQKLTFHSSHFLQRYNERFLLWDSTSKSELMEEFTIRNPLSTTIDIPVFKYADTKLFAYLEDGIGLGYKEMVSNHTFEYMKTFITHDMIHSGQKQYASITNELFESVMEQEPKLNNN